MQRADGRALGDHRAVEVMVGFQRNAEGSVLYRAGRTVVLCTASIDATVPAWMAGKGRGWITAEYQMHPRSSPSARAARRPRQGAERAHPGDPAPDRPRLAAAVDLKALGERTITIDCDVLEADGGTRTASVTGGFLALALALDKLAKHQGQLGPVLSDQVAAISVGCSRPTASRSISSTPRTARPASISTWSRRIAAHRRGPGHGGGRGDPARRARPMIDLGLGACAPSRSSSDALRPRAST
jgi:ribonuclease PH